MSAEEKIIAALPAFLPADAKADLAKRLKTFDDKVVEQNRDLYTRAVPSIVWSFVRENVTRTDIGLDKLSQTVNAMEQALIGVLQEEKRI